MDQKIQPQNIITRTFNPILIAKAIWDSQMNTMPNSFGEFIKKKLMTIGKFISLK